MKLLSPTENIRIREFACERITGMALVTVLGQEGYILDKPITTVLKVQEK